MGPVLLGVPFHLPFVGWSTLKNTTFFLPKQSLPKAEAQFQHSNVLFPLVTAADFSSKVLNPQASETLLGPTIMTTGGAGGLTVRLKTYSGAVAWVSDFWCYYFSTRKTYRLSKKASNPAKQPCQVTVRLEVSYRAVTRNSWVVLLSNEKAAKRMAPGRRSRSVLQQNLQRKKLVDLAFTCRYWLIFKPRFNPEADKSAQAAEPCRYSHVTTTLCGVDEAVELPQDEVSASTSQLENQTPLAMVKSWRRQWPLQRTGAMSIVTAT